MSDTLFIVVAVALGILLGIALVFLIGTLAIAVDARITRRRRLARRTVDEDEPPDGLAAFGVDISVWPSRAPRNGQSHEEASA